MQRYPVICARVPSIIRVVLTQRLHVDLLRVTSAMCRRTDCVV